MKTRVMESVDDNGVTIGPKTEVKQIRVMGFKISKPVCYKVASGGGEGRLLSALRDGEEPGAPPRPCQPPALMRGNESDALSGGKIFCFGVSERRGVRLPMLL